MTSSHFESYLIVSTDQLNAHVGPTGKKLLAPAIDAADTSVTT